MSLLSKIKPPRFKKLDYAYQTCLVNVNYVMSRNVPRFKTGVTLFFECESTKFEKSLQYSFCGILFDRTIYIILCTIPLNTYKPAFFSADSAILRYVKQFFPERYTQKVNYTRRSGWLSVL
jgi:hypothetical protein